MKMKRSKRIWSALMISIGLILASAVVAQAAPIASSPYTDGRDLFANGTQWTAAFLYADAGDTSNLYELVTPTGIIFQNNNLGVYPIGMTKSYASTAGQALTFSLVDLSVPATWNTGLASTNVAYYDFVSIANLEFLYGVDLSLAAETALNSLNDAYPGQVLVIGYEDRALAGSDRDFNDLIFAFAPLQTSKVPEPTTILLLGLGLVGLAGLRRK
jgi:hypothetical protein